MARDSRLHHDAAAGREEPIAAERKATAPEGRAAKAGRLAVTRLRSAVARLLCGAQHLVDEALGLARSCAADAPGPDAEVLPATAHRREPEMTRISDSAESRVVIIDLFAWERHATRPNGTEKDKP